MEELLNKRDTVLGKLINNYYECDDDTRVAMFCDKKNVDTLLVEEIKARKLSLCIAKTPSITNGQTEMDIINGI